MKSARVIISASALAMLFSGCFGDNNPTPIPSPTPSSVPYVYPTPTTSGTADAYTGSQPVTEAEYHYGAANDSQVLSTAATEEWAEVYRPVNLGSTPHPVILMLHGNHATCGTGGNGTAWVQSSCAYTTSGQCNAGESVIPNHLGYGYLAERLASFGYVVVSINANLGITCGTGVSGDQGLVLARGRLVLRHLQLLSQWNAVDGTTPTTLGVNFYGKLDLSNVGLFGHSRGGEGVRAAYQQYTASGSQWPSQMSSPVTFKAIFEVSPTDGLSTTVLTPAGVAWNVILPMCDGDVTDLAGMKPFDRVLASSSESPASAKSMYAVWGANHDFFNSYWQDSDSNGCVGAGNNALWNSGDAYSTNQQETAVGAVIPFFRAHLGAGADPTLANVLNPVYPIPTPISQITRIDRTYVDSPNSANVSRVETFQGATGTGSLGQPETKSNVGLTHTTVQEHDSSLSAANITWTGVGSSIYYQDNWTAAGNGLNMSGVSTVDFRVSNEVTDPNSGVANFSIQLVAKDGSLGPAVLLSKYFSLAPAVGSAGSKGQAATSLYHYTLATVRIPVADLGNLASASGIRFTFDQTANGNILVSDIDLTTGPKVVLAQAPLPIEPLAKPLALSSQSVMQAFEFLSRGPASISSVGTNRIAAIEQVAIDNPKWKITLQSEEGFRVRDALPVLKVDGRAVAYGSISANGDLHNMTFELDAAQVNGLPDQFQMEVGHQGDAATTGFGIGNRSYFQ